MWSISMINDDLYERMIRERFPDEGPWRTSEEKLDRLNCGAINVDPRIFWSGNTRGWHASVPLYVRHTLPSRPVTNAYRSSGELKSRSEAAFLRPASHKVRFNTREGMNRFGDGARSSLRAFGYNFINLSHCWNQDFKHSKRSQSWTDGII